MLATTSSQVAPVLIGLFLLAVAFAPLWEKGSTEKRRPHDTMIESGLRFMERDKERRARRCTCASHLTHHKFFCPRYTSTPSHNRRR